MCFSFVPRAARWTLVSSWSRLFECLGWLFAVRFVFLFFILVSFGGGPFNKYKLSTRTLETPVHDDQNTPHVHKSLTKLVKCYCGHTKTHIHTHTRSLTHLRKAVDCEVVVSLCEQSCSLHPLTHTPANA